MVTAQQKKLWNENYDLLLEYKQEHGHCNIPQSGIFNGQQLGAWVDTQRQRYKKGTLLHDRLVRLIEFGFKSMKLNSFQNRWNEKYDLLVEYKQ